MHASRRPGLVAALLLLLASHTGAVELPPDYRGKATDQAFAALLSMPSAAPDEGEWIIPRPADFQPGDEARLIAFLDGQLDRGAELEARRHFGTLLQHALRARLGQTALWLLVRGADPRPASGADALMLARRYGLDEVAQQLIEQHGLRGPDPVPPVAAPAAPAALPLHQRLQRHRDDAARLDAERAAILAELHAAPTLPTSEWDLRAWVAISAGDPAQLELLLDRLATQDPLPIKPLLDGMLWAAEDAGNRSPIFRAPPIESWRLLWRVVGTPLDYRPGSWVGDGRLLGLFPAAHLDELLDSGYAALGEPQAIGCQLAQWDAAQLQRHWPVLTAHFPDLPRRAVTLVLDPYRLGSACYFRDRDDTLAKLRLLRSWGLDAPVSGLSEVALRQRASPALREAIASYRAPPPQGAPRLQAVAPRCQPQQSEVLYQRLLRLRGLDGAPVDLLQWVELPGQTRCALLLAGVARVESADYDSFYGPYRDPMPSCPDPVRAVEVWWEDADGRLQEIPAEASWFGEDRSGLQWVEDRTDGQRYYLSGAPQAGRCQIRPQLPTVLQFVMDDDGPRLARATLAPDTRDVLIDQCDDEGCKLPAPADADPMDEGVHAPTDLDSMLASWPAEHGGTLRQQYLDAGLALDRPLLKVLKARGVPAAWTREAILAVADSELPLAERRRRIAWLFHDHEQLAAALNPSVVERLRDWLPLEDWGPVLRVIEAQPLLWNQPLVPLDVEPDRRLSRLDCALQHAQQQLCGGGWRVE
ncbi:MAG: hypothetical protein MUE46_00150 [Xanthomonadales bacterium]|jgi:hypothetical protein|nr:hypothetical protein [Xanthomonadales bacterium]